MIYLKKLNDQEKALGEYNAMLKKINMYKVGPRDRYYLNEMKKVLEN